LQNGFSDLALEAFPPGSLDLAFDRRSVGLGNGC
jgi:hypothetical protein